MQTDLNIARTPRVLTPAERAEAELAVALLDGTGISLIEAAQRALNGPRVMRCVGFTVALDEFMLTRIRDGLARASVDWYDGRLRPLARIFGTQIFASITQEELRGQLEAVFPTLPARAGAARACRALWRWGMRCEPAIVGADITIGLQFTISPGAQK